MKVKTMATSGIIAALYVAVTFLVAPFGFTNIQFRLSEMFNHLVVFNKKYIIGVVLGVFIANLLFSELGPIDLVFGVGHSFLLYRLQSYPRSSSKDYTDGCFSIHLYLRSRCSLLHGN